MSKILTFLRRRWRRLLCGGLALVALLVAGWLLLPRCSLLPEGLTWSREVRDRDGSLLRLTLTADGKYRVWTPLREMPPDFVRATLAHEDRRFRDHRGVDGIAVGRAVWGVLSGTPRGGASTISMQLARLRFGLNTRTLAGKAEQMFRAVQLERHYTKDEILEAYLNLAPYGGNVEGVGAASRRWLGKRPADCTFHECIALSLVPQRPARRSPGAVQPDVAFAALMENLCRTVRGSALPGDRDYRLPAARWTAPDIAPHAVRRLVAAAPPGTEAITATLDSRLQRVLEQSVAEFVREQTPQGVKNAAAILVHAPDMSVRACVGSAGFSNAAISGQVDGVQARRSPGSLLKPFIYALAVDQGLIHARTLLRDTPRAFGEYRPENFDRGFAGPLTAADALYRSRNLPAVELMNRLAAPGFYGFLQAGGVALNKPASHYGLTLTLGGAEIRMDEAAALYAMLARDGAWRPLRWKTADPLAAGQPLLSPAACWMVRSMLLPPAQPAPGEPYTAGHPHVSWKTGTSNGFRDAWAAGICGDWVLVVWVGDFTGKSSAAYTGRATAGPLLFQSLSRLELPAFLPPPPAPLAQVNLCAVSGDLPGPHCPHHCQGWYLPGTSPVAACRLHQEIYIDAASGRRVPADDGRPGLRREVFECWPPDMLALFRAAGIPRREPPAMESAAAVVATAPHGKLRITSPRAALTYSLRASATTPHTIPLKAEADAGATTVFWFAGREFIGSGPAGQPLHWNATPGTTQLKALDDLGRAATCDIRVEMVP